jgi:hypothetical protein
VNILTKRTIVPVPFTKTVNADTTFFFFILSKALITNTLSSRGAKFSSYFMLSALRTNIRSSSVE